jgi:hypothetical protein
MVTDQCGQEIGGLLGIRSGLFLGGKFSREIASSSLAALSIRVQACSVSRVAVARSSAMLARRSFEFC